VCNALALLQCVASHPETRTLFLKAHIPLFLYPFLNTISKTRPFEYLRLTSLGVIGALVKMDDSDVINFLLTTEIIPLCLRIMESGSELSKTVATFIVQKILLDDMGLQYVCTTAEVQTSPAETLVEEKYRVFLPPSLTSSICAFLSAKQRFFAVSNVLSSMVVGLAKEPSVRLLKHIIRCYLRLSENIRARDALRHCLPGD
jgi:CCR4-NOT transcription complex subunit 9